MTDQDGIRQHGEVYRRKTKLAGTQKPCISLCVLVAMYVYVCVRERERDEFELLTKPFGIPGLHMYLI